MKPITIKRKRDQIKIGILLEMKTRGPNHKRKVKV